VTLLLCANQGLASQTFNFTFNVIKEPTPLFTSESEAPMRDMLLHRD